MRNQPLPGAAACVAAASVLIMAMLPQPVVAKSLFESIFGFLQSSPEPRILVRPRPAEIDQSNPFEGDRSRRVVPYGGGRYRTVCVRLCDGYFFPVSNASGRRDFYRDAQQCQSTCQSETRLFYMSPSNPSIKTARDQRGLAYSDLKTAFLYRKKYSKTCTCRPAPWSVSERMRHKSYLPGAEQRIASVANDTAKNGVGPTLAARPQMVDRGDGILVPAPVALPHPPAPRAAWQPVARARRAAPWRQRPRHQTTNDSGWGLASGLPKVRYRHDWSTD
ncbi:MAG: DUF2865 domain-containing protein [Hyphomicrobiaceae bacterium]